MCLCVFKVKILSGFVYSFKGSSVVLYVSREILKKKKICKTIYISVKSCEINSVNTVANC